MRTNKVVASWEALNVDTPCGIFIRNDCNMTPFWVVRADIGKIAIQLTRCTNRSAFSYIELSSETAFYGRCRGHAYLTMDDRSSVTNALSNLVGTIQHRSWWITIRLAVSDGSTWRCLIADREQKTFAASPVTFRRWSLLVDEREYKNQFDLEARPKPGPYHERVLDQAPANVVSLR